MDRDATPSRADPRRSRLGCKTAAPRNHPHEFVRASAGVLPAESDGNDDGEAHGHPTTPSGAAPEVAERHRRRAQSYDSGPGARNAVASAGYGPAERSGRTRGGDSAGS